MIGTALSELYIHNNIIAVNDGPEQLPALYVDADIDHAVLFNRLWLQQIWPVWLHLIAATTLFTVTAEVVSVAVAVVCDLLYCTQFIGRKRIDFCILFCNAFTRSGISSV